MRILIFIAILFYTNYGSNESVIDFQIFGATGKKNIIYERNWIEKIEQENNGFSLHQWAVYERHNLTFIVPANGLDNKR